MNLTLGGDDVTAGRGDLEHDPVDPGDEAEPGQLGGGGGGCSVFGIAVTQSQQSGPEPVLPLALAGLGRKVGSSLLVQDHHHGDLFTVDRHVDDVPEPGQPDVLLTELDTEGGGLQLPVLVHHGDNVIAACEGEGVGDECGVEVVTCQEVVVSLGGVSEGEEERSEGGSHCECSQP